MPRFIFPLETLLTQRKRQEQECQRQLALESQKLVEINQRLKEMDDSLTAANEDMRHNRLVGSVDTAFLAGHRRFVLAIQKQAMALIPELQAQQQRVNLAQRALTEAAVRRKVIEKLREKQFDRWRADLSKKEEAELDEVGMKLAYPVS